jgi:hypothetical protein
MPSTRQKKNIQVGDVVSSKEIHAGSSTLVFVINEEVVETLLVDERLGAILLSNPTIVEVNGERQFFDGPFIGWKYDGEKFINPNIN